MAQFKTQMLCLFAVAALVGWCSRAQATVIAFGTPSGASMSGSGNVDAQAVFTTSANQVTITLTNLEVNPGDVGQNISGLTFSLSPSTGESSATLASSSGMERTVNSNDTYTDGSSVAVGWKLTSNSSDIFLDGLSGTYTPAHTIIGPPASTNLYSGANGSIENGPHNPFLAGNVQFTLSVPGMTANTTIDNVVFSFGTTSGSDLGGNVVPSPEPATMALLLMGLPALLRRRAAK